MSHNTRVRADYAAWATYTGVSAAEFEKFDANLFKAINGDEGGTWAPSSVIDIGGAGVQVESLLTVGADGVFVSRCNSHLEGQVFCQSGILIYNTGTLTVQGAASFTGPFSADGSVTIGDNASVDTLNVTATQTYNGPETHNGTETHNGAVTVNGLATATAGFASTGITALGNNSTVDTLNVQAIQTYAGAETHNGTETHNGEVTVNGLATATAGFASTGNTALGNNSTVDTLNVRAIQTYAGAESHNGAVVFNGTFSARVDNSPIYFAGDNSITISNLLCRDYVFSLENNHTFNIALAAPPPEGTRVTVWIRSQMYNLNIQIDGTRLTSLGGTGGPTCLLLVYHGASWIPLFPGHGA